MPRVAFRPPLFNSASPWATTKTDLQDLYNSPFTGAVTTRTSLLAGFPHSPSIHQHTLFDSPTISLNTYGYSPYPLKFYLDTVKSVIADTGKPQTKPFIISITGTPEEVAEAVAVVNDVAKTGYDLLVEANLSCPNIPDKPPPAYSLPELKAYLDLLSKLKAGVPIGLKMPPYTYDAQFQVLLSALKAYPSLVSFITLTNTLGSSLHLSSQPSLVVSGGRRATYQPTLSSPSGTGIGGLGGASIHWLSLGNVSTIRRMLDQAQELKDIAVIGVGGVGDRDGWERMLSVGAEGVGVATALGKNGVGVFAKILSED